MNAPRKTPIAQFIKNKKELEARITELEAENAQLGSERDAAIYRGTQLEIEISKLKAQLEEESKHPRQVFLDG